MLLTVLILVLLMAAAGSGVAFRRPLNPFTLFAAVWVVVLLVHLTDRLGLYPLSNATIVAIWLMAGGVALGAFAGFRTTAPSREGTVGPVHRFYASAMVWLTALGWMGVVLFLGTNTVPTRFGADYERLDPTFIGVSAVVREFILRIAIPGLATAVVVGAALLARLSGHTYGSARSLKRKLLIVVMLAGVGLLVYDTMALKRIQTITLFAGVVVGLMFSPRMGRRSFTHVVASTIVAVVLAYTIGVVTVVRDIARPGDVIDSWLLYLAGPTTFFDALLTEHQLDERFHGSMVTMGARGYLFGFLVTVPKIGNLVPRIPEEYFARQEPARIGPSQRFNAFGTIMLDPYLDLGLPGIAVLSVFTGWAAAAGYVAARSSIEPWRVAWGAVGALWLLWSPIGWAGGLQFSVGGIPVAIGVLEFWRRTLSRLRTRGHS